MIGELKRPSYGSARLQRRSADGPQQFPVDCPDHFVLWMSYDIQLTGGPEESRMSPLSQGFAGLFGGLRAGRNCVL